MSAYYLLKMGPARQLASGAIDPAVVESYLRAMQYPDENPDECGGESGSGAGVKTDHAAFSTVATRTEAHSADASAGVPPAEKAKPAPAAAAPALVAAGASDGGSYSSALSSDSDSSMEDGLEFDGQLARHATHHHTRV